MKVLKRYSKRLAPVGVALVLVAAITSPAQAATYSSITVTPADPTPNASSVTYTASVSSATGGSVGCLKLTVDTAADFSSGSLPASFSITGNPGGTSLFTAGTWTGGPTTATNTVTWVSSGGMTSASGSSKTFTFSAHNPNPGSATTYYTKIETFTNTNCSTGPIDTGSGAFVITPNTLVSVTVEPSFIFAVNAQPSSTACNGVTSTVTTTGATVPLGTINPSIRSVGVQQLQVTTNATGGYNVYMRSAATTTNVMKGSGSNVITDSGAVALPSAGTSFFGYTSDQTASAITSGEVRTVPVSPGGAAVVGYRSAGSASATNNCVGYGVSASGATAADSYSTTILYTAVPNY